MMRYSLKKNVTGLSSLPLRVFRNYRDAASITEICTGNHDKSSVYTVAAHFDDVLFTCSINRCNLATIAPGKTERRQENKNPRTAEKEKKATLKMYC